MTSLVFHVTYLASIVSVAWVLLLHRISARKRLALVLIWALCVRLTFALRVPDGVLSNLPDTLYENQIVESIITSGRLVAGQGTGEASYYSFYPLLETFIVELSVLPNLSSEVVVKFLGPTLISTLTLVFLFEFFTRCLDHNEALVALFISAGFTEFLAYTTHPNFGALFLSMFLYSQRSNGRPYKIVSVLATAAMNVAHFLTPYLLVILLFSTFAFVQFWNLLQKALRKRFPPLMHPRILLLLVIFLTWNVYTGTAAFFKSFEYNRVILVYLIESGLVRMGFPLTAKARVLSPEWMRLLSAAGRMTYAGLLVAGILMLMWGRGKERCYRILHYAFGSTIVFAVFVVVWGIGIPAFDPIRDLVNRSYWLTYFVSAPLATHALLFMNRRLVSSCTRTRAFARATVTIAIISLCVVPALYSMPAYLYDNTVPLHEEDVRLPLTEWKIMGIWCRRFLGDGVVWGDNLAFSYVGAYGWKNIWVFPETGDMSSWYIQNVSAGQYVVLRLSALDAPYMFFRQTQRSVSYVVSLSNIVYGSHDVKLLCAIGKK
jgi:hypothetical protein